MTLRSTLAAIALIPLVVSPASAQGKTAAPASEDAAAELVTAFINLCMEAVPDFQSTPGRLSDMGFLFESPSEGYVEFRQPAGHVGGVVAVGDTHFGFPLCEVTSEAATQPDVHRLFEPELSAELDEPAATYAVDQDEGWTWRVSTRYGDISVWLDRSPADRPDRGVSLGLGVGY